MTRFNLLPWREAYRVRKNKEFYIAMALCASVTSAAGFGGLQYAQSKVDFQQKRNERIEHEIATLQEELREIDELEETRNELLSRMEIIQHLQAQRPKIVHTFYEVAAHIPDGVYLTSMQQKENTLALEGKAESSARVSELMRNMGKSEHFHSPLLEIIENNQRDGVASFKLSLIQAGFNTEVSENEYE